MPGKTWLELRTEKSDDLAAACMDIAWMCAGRLSSGELIATSTRLTDLSTTMGTVIDKARLLQGQSTAITETKIQNHRWAEEELQKLMRECNWTREQALEQIKEKAPTWVGMLM